MCLRVSLGCFLVLFSSDMLVYLFLPFVNRFVPAAANESPLKKVVREVSSRHPYGVPPSETYAEFRYHSEPRWKWDALATGPTDANKEAGRYGFQKTKNPFSNLEISKSIELTFDPNMQLLTPVNGDSAGNRNEVNDVNKNSLSLLTLKTQKQFGKIIETFEKEAKGVGGLADMKNYQTGRFKLYYLKRARFMV